MKYLLLVICFASLAFARRASHKQENDVALEKVMSSYRELREKLLSRFPSREFNQFWEKLEEGFGDEKDELYSIVKKHEGDMDMSLAEIANRLGTDAPTLKNRWEQVKKYTTEKSLLQMFKDVKNILEEHLQARHGMTVEQMMEQFQTQVKRAAMDNGDSLKALFQAAVHEFYRMHGQSRSVQDSQE